MKLRCSYVSEVKDAETGVVTDVSVCGDDGEFISNGFSFCEHHVQSIARQQALRLGVLKEQGG